jgi:hypothetical protein
VEAEQIIHSFDSELRCGQAISVELFLPCSISRRLGKSALCETCIKPAICFQEQKKVSRKLYAFRVPAVRLNCHKLLLSKNGLIIITEIWLYVETKEEGTITGFWCVCMCVLCVWGVLCHNKEQLVYGGIWQCICAEGEH